MNEGALPWFFKWEKIVAESYLYPSHQCLGEKCSPDSLSRPGITKYFCIILGIVEYCQLMRLRGLSLSKPL